VYPSVYCSLRRINAAYSAQIKLLAVIFVFFFFPFSLFSADADDNCTPLKRLSASFPNLPSLPSLSRVCARARENLRAVPKISGDLNSHASFVAALSRVSPRPIKKRCTLLRIRIPASWNYSRSRRIYFQRRLPRVPRSSRISLAMKTQNISFPLSAAFPSEITKRSR